MVKLPMSDYVYHYYKEQGTDFTFRQQAHLCWAYNDLLKDQMQSLRDILEISDDGILNAEIRERLEYEEKAYGRFLENNDPGCIYVVHPDDLEEYDEYFSSAQNAVLYGKQHFAGEYRVIKQYLADKYPEELSDGGETEESNIIQSDYHFTPDGEVRYGYSYDRPVPFDDDDPDRFENMFLNIKSPFGIGDIVMGEDLDYPAVVSTGHDCFEKTYDRFKGSTLVNLDGADNCIRIDYIGKDGRPYYDHEIPFHLWKIDSWDDGEYWNILQVMGKLMKAGTDVFEWDCLLREYREHHKMKDE